MKDDTLGRRIIAALLTVSLLPLVLMGLGAWKVYGRLLDQKALQLQRGVVESHARAIDAYLTERLNSLRLLAAIHSLDEIARLERLDQLFLALNSNSEGGFQDLGVIGEDGAHLAYVGPYDLMKCNYAETDWFKEVMAKGHYFSDVFLGFRNSPHSIIAVKVQQNGKTWILRATIDSERFNSLVQTGVLGASGEAYIINRAGLYQTKTKMANVLDPSPISTPDLFTGVRDQNIRSGDDLKIRVTTWIPRLDWLLVVERNAAEVRAPVRQAAINGAFLALLSMILIVATTIIATHRLTSRIEQANAKREEMTRAFTRSARLASIGEMATGLAHEINNPLAVISSEQTNISDLSLILNQDDPNVREILESVERSKHQIQRCKAITTKMLQFGRQRETELVPTDLRQILNEIGELLDRQAKVRNVELSFAIEEPLPEVKIDGVELEQVLVNLIQNSFQALPDGGHVQVRFRRVGSEALLEVSDDGTGIAPENLERVFEPFFTTKPVGQGTGLGLSVCYGLAQSWGGMLEAESTISKGTTMRVRIPLMQN